ncbi:putative benzoate 4-monooxygenase cytochrome P450 [Tilletiaria anomala UBC 951]|uniref:Putative benzoate 4-monooxygenase cytochrome P450 n=1 Tax=Tilletiaria anomala (strain ATCC 24038 / CBS 436.72 / UBC 951) TaxID=1037660 RepID=A0A066WHI7_TILAU|nr:putative benzoate 4-monooxygenase cytochrome P450 [Tilletiaria anomala UBC 951]KDN51978.1 putative benzoate 4-monooxygenase cytochrome P450 [Tilletiaria anomala UBC 951]
MVESDLVVALRNLGTWSLSSLINIVITLALAVALAHVVPFLINYSAIGVPGPLLAKFSDIWLVLQAKSGHRSENVHVLHKKYGKFVRLAPNHISVADHEALQPVYGHSTGTLKAPFYSAFVPPRPFPRGLFNTQDRAEHSRKRKIVSHTFAPRSIVQFEPFIRREAHLLLERWDELSVQAEEEAAQGPRGLKGFAWIDVLEWMNFWAFDTIGTLAFGAAFGMLETGKDRARVEYEDPSTGKKTVDDCSAIKIINERGEYSGTMGCAPEWIRPYLAKLPWFAQRLKSVKALTGIALARVNDRLLNGSEREDLLAMLQAAKDETGEPMGKMELTAEALTQLIAGSDTTSNTSCAILYHLITHPQALNKLRAELDSALKDAEEVPLYSDVKELPYLNAVINESLRYHSTSGIGLPRLIPAPGTHICGKYFPAGSVVSVPAYTIHRDPKVFGADAEEYSPDRWLAKGAAQRFEKSFIPFSIGPRACVGRNVALQELAIIVASLVRRYDFELRDPGMHFDTAEGFLRKPLTLPAGIKRRTTAK